MLCVVMDEYRSTVGGEKRPFRRKKVEQYGFIKLKAVADQVGRVRGEVPEADGEPVMFIGRGLSKHYWASRHVSECDIDVLEWLEESQYTVFHGVDGGWKDWNGQPEFDSKYVDFRGSEPYNLSDAIERRRKRQ